MRLVGRRAVALPKRLLDQADRLIDGAYLRGGKLEARRPHVFINQQQPRWLEALRDQAAEKPADIAKVMQRVVEHDQIEALMGNLNSAVFFLVRKFYMLRCLLGALYFDMRRFGVFWVFSKHKIPRPNQWGSMKNHKK